jgi:hypothetical protein
VAPQTVSVRFTETFLRDSAEVLTDDELQLLALVLAENPSCGKVQGEIRHLRRLAWTHDATVWSVWYLYYQGTPHIEVVALTEPGAEVANDATSMRRATWWVLRIGFGLRIAYRAYRFVREHWPDDLTGIM